MSERRWQEIKRKCERERELINHFFIITIQLEVYKATHNCAMIETCAHNVHKITHRPHAQPSYTHYSITYVFM